MAIPAPAKPGKKNTFGVFSGVLEVAVFGSFYFGGRLNISIVSSC